MCVKQPIIQIGKAENEFLITSNASNLGGQTTTKHTIVE